MKVRNSYLNYKTIKNDIIFKNLFSAKENEDLLVDFLESVLEKKIHTIEVQKEVETKISNLNEKLGRMDIVATINNELVVDLEMQNINYGDTEKRAVFYAGNLIKDAIKPNEKYENIKDIAVIWILDYELNENEEYFTETMTVDKKYCKYEIIKGVKYYFIELPKFRKMVTNKLETKLEEWLAIIDYTKKGMIEMAINQNEKVKRAKEECEYLQGDEAVKRIEELRNRAIRDEKAAFSYGMKQGEAKGEARGEVRGEKRGISIGKKIGETRGRRESLIATAKNMLKNNIDIAIIQKCTGLSLNEVKRL